MMPQYECFLSNPGIFRGNFALNIANNNFVRSLFLSKSDRMRRIELVLESGRVHPSHPKQTLCNLNLINEACA